MSWCGFHYPVTSHWTCGHLWPMDSGFLSHVKPGTFESELKTVDSHTWRCCCLAVNVVTRKNILRSKGFFKWNTTHENHSCGANPDEESSTWITLFASVRSFFHSDFELQRWGGPELGVSLVVVSLCSPALSLSWGEAGGIDEAGRTCTMTRAKNVPWETVTYCDHPQIWQKKKDLLIRFITFWNNLILQQNVSACPVPCPIAVSRVSDSACSMASSLASSLASSVVSSPPSSRVSCMGLSCLAFVKNGVHQESTI